MSRTTPRGWTRALIVAGGLALSAAAGAQKFPGLAATPPMGWSSWNRFGCAVDERLIREMADALVASGMREAGYVYVNVDDCWQGERDADGFITANRERFPSGIRALADFVHARGLRLGLYTDLGWKTCGGRPGSRGREYQDALTFARWGVDYLKVDWCHTEGLDARGAYLTMREALASAGRPMVLSICEWGESQPWTWAGEIGHLWRTTGDIEPCWDCEVDHGGWSSWGVLRILDRQKGLRGQAGPGRWNDPDMLEVGNGMTTGEDRAHFTLWCMLAAPLLASNDLRDMSAETRRILTTRAVIAVDQDPLGIQGFRWRAEGDLEVWFRPLAGGAWAMCALNRGSAVVRAEFDWDRERVADDLSGRRAGFERTTYRVVDLWTGREAGTTREPFRAELSSHDVVLVRLEPTGGEVTR